MSEEVAKYESAEIVKGGVFESAGGFELAQRQAKMLASSKLVPETYRNNIADCVIALEMAQRIGASPLAIMQNMYIVHGKPAWSSQFLVSCINASGRFSPLRYKITGKKGTDTWGCIAYAVDKDGETLEGPEVTIAMAKAEGWINKNGSKWKTMPDLMLRYRAATFFARLFAPELSMGIQTHDEVVDIAPVVTEPVNVGVADFTKDLADKLASSKKAKDETAKPKTKTIDDLSKAINIPADIINDYYASNGVTVDTTVIESAMSDIDGTKAAINAFADGELSM